MPWTGTASHLQPVDHKLATQSTKGQIDGFGRLKPRARSSRFDARPAAYLKAGKRTVYRPAQKGIQSWCSSLGTLALSLLGAGSLDRESINKKPDAKRPTAQVRATGQVQESR